jgi:dTDP-4-amino-4,6-dideoxygalactose transaminase
MRMKIPFVDLATQYSNIKPEIDSAIQGVIDSLAFVGTSKNPHVKAFERAFGEYAGARYCIACANGTDAIEIVLRAAGIGPGDEVLVPALTWIATAESVSHAGGKPVFVDIDPQTYTISPEDARAKITSKTRAILPVHLYGLPADMEAILSIAEEHHLLVFEDCAQAHGAAHQGKHVGTIGRAGTFSFFPGKNLGAYGDAGGIITDDQELADNARMICQHGQTTKKFEHKIEGRNSRMDGIQAAILSAKLPHLEEWTEARIAAARMYTEKLSGLPVDLPACPEGSRHVYHLYAVMTEDRDALRGYLAEREISSGCQYPVALPFVEAYGDWGHRVEDFPVAHQVSGRVITLPVYPEITAEQVDRVAGAVREFFS